VDPEKSIETPEIGVDTEKSIETPIFFYKTAARWQSLSTTAGTVG